MFLVIVVVCLLFGAAVRRSMVCQTKMPAFIDQVAINENDTGIADIRENSKFDRRHKALQVLIII